MQNKKELFAQQPQTPQTFKVNNKFADKFQKKKEREHIDKMKSKFGKNYEEKLQDDLDSSSDSIEDEHGDMINDTVTSKFLDTLAKLRFKHPKIYKTEKEIFHDADFDNQIQSQKDKKLNYGRTQREQFLQDIGNEDIEDSEQQSNSHSMVPEEEQTALKDAFKQAALVQKSGSLLNQKTKTTEQISGEGQAFDVFLQRAKQNQPKDEVEVLKRFWNKQEDLDEKDKFLRKFILNKGWIDQDDINEQEESNSSQEEKADNYEEKYNFRYEQPGGTQITTYERGIEDTVRQAGNEKRKESRKNKDLRKQEEKMHLEKEIEILKKAKKAQLFERLHKIKEVSGIDFRKTENLLDSMKDDFQEKQFDKQMNDMFNEEYYENEDSGQEELQQDIKSYYDDKKEVVIKQSLGTSKLNEAIENAIEIKKQIPLMMRKNLKEEEILAIKEQDINIWWYCDECQIGIQPKEYRFDCQECEDYTLCKDCLASGCHSEKNHKLKRSLVPASCKPPQQEEIVQMLSEFKQCTGCQFKLGSQSDYYQLQDQSGLILCEECFENEPLLNKNKFQKFQAEQVDYEELLDKNPTLLKEHLQDKQLQKIVDEYYDLDFEDVIAGGLKTKFKYVEVEKADFGLTDDDLLYCDDELLNQYISIKKLFPYRQEDIKLQPARQRRLLKSIQICTKKNKKQIFREQRRITEIEGELKQTKNPAEFVQLKEKMEQFKKVSKLPPSKRHKLKLEENQEDPLQEEEYVQETTIDKKVKLNPDRLKSYGL